MSHFMFRCTFDTREIRDDIESMFDDYKSFALPEKYSVKFVPSASSGFVAKIVEDNPFQL